ncbi:MAG: hypothetical protein H0U55_07320 [Rubrobacteraceae bacterium]|nr:hypothetical protein [Rubrobacteraceae bacterium]
MGTFLDHEEASEAARRWTRQELPGLVEEIEAGLVGRLGGARRAPWWPRVLGER